MSHHLPQFDLLPVEALNALVSESNESFVASKEHPNQKTVELLVRFRTDPEYVAYGYTVDGKPASYILALSHKGAGTIAIGPMYVANDFRGQGLGKQQAADFIDHYQNAGYTTIATRTWSSNTASTAIFEQLGFRVVETIPGDRVNGDATLLFELQLPS